MKTLVFIKKELLDSKRNGKMLILGITFVLFGIMSPALAKLTPWIMEMYADQLAETGVVVGNITVDAVSSWSQFVKNIPMAIIVYILVCGNIYTKEYQSGTLVLLLTKGLKRSEVVIAKAIFLLLGWTVGYFLVFGITYGYNAYFWDNSIMPNLCDIAVGWWLFGVFAVALTVFFSTLAGSSSGVMLGTLAGVVISYILSTIPKIAPYVPTTLMSAGEADITKAIIVTSILSALLLVSAIPLMNKKAM